jgi:hypothetical protein
MADNLPNKDPQARRWQITINNPLDKDMTHEAIKKKLEGFKAVIYYCMSDEQGENGTPHTHVFAAFSSSVRFSSIKNAFETAHIEKAMGSAEDNRQYILKEGKWVDDVKHGTRIEGTFEEWGTIPKHSGGFNYGSAAIVEMIQDGASNAEILKTFPDSLNALRNMDYARQTLKEDEYRNQWRDLETTYIYGDTGLGKTRYVMDKYGYEKVYRVTDYKKNPFDGYRPEHDVLVFDEFDGDIKLQQMNNYLDGYPLQLPARYGDKQACYTKVYIISNIELFKFYAFQRVNERPVWDAFIRRIHKIIHFVNQEFKIKYTMQQYIENQNMFTGKGC